MQPDHADPTSEANQKIMERVMALAAMTEAASRLAARQRERKEELKRLLALEQLQLREKLAGMPLLDVAKTWRTARQHAKTDPNARTVRDAAEAELRKRWPKLMGIYDEGIRRGLDPLHAMQAAGLRHAEDLIFDQHPHLRRLYDEQRKQGRNPAEAMANAMANAMADVNARQHGATSDWTASPSSGKTAIGGNPAALGRELTLATQWMDPIHRAQWIEALRQSGADPAAVAWTEQLLADVGRQIATGAQAAGETDLSATPAVDEHTAGLRASVSANGRGAQEASQAAAVAATQLTTTVAAPRTGDPVRLMRMSFGVRAELGLLTPGRPGAGKVIEGQVLQEPVKTRGPR